MGCLLATGRKEACKDNAAGIRYVYLFTYVYYTPDNFGGMPSETLTSFPATTVYKYEAQNVIFNERNVTDERGTYWQQDLTLDLPGQTSSDTNTLMDAMDFELRCVIEFNNGTFRVGGLYNGLTITSIDAQSGGSIDSFNGYKLRLEGEERYKSPYISSLDIITGTIGERLLEDGFNRLLESGSNRLLEA